MMTWWSTRYLRSIDLRVIPVIFALMIISLLVISANDYETNSEEVFFNVRTLSQLRWFLIGWAVYLFFAGLDYQKLRDLTWLLYLGMLLSLAGLFFTESSHGVHRWYRLPGMTLQPSEIAKLIVVMSLSWFLERRRQVADRLSTVFWGGLIVGIPFVLILKQPDLGTALVLYPITLVMFYFGDIHPTIVKLMTIAAAAGLVLVLLIFLGVFSHEEIRPYATLFLKEYQYDRLDPNSHHQKAAVTAIAIGGATGTGWRESEFTGRGWLPEAQTDSVFPAFGEEFGFVGMLFLIGLFYSLIYFSFQASAMAKDYYGRLLSAGITVYLAMHILINIGMMCGLLPITGVPLILVTYGGSSVLVTMAALGILQSIYSRRFMF